MSSLLNIQEKIKKKDVSCEELIRSTLDEITTKNKNLNAFIDVFDTRAISIAKAQDDAMAQGKAVKPFAGIPFAIKDNMCLEGELVTCASKMLSGYRSPFTSTAVLNMINAGFIPVGRTNMDEFAMGSSNEYSVYGPVSNPWATGHVSGGSSGGSAAAVAAGMVPVALGSDTGGSIRQPASFCGVVGVKPTYGRVSRYGLVAFASSLDQIGPFCQHVKDAALVTQVLSGFDPNDSTSEPNVEPLRGDNLNLTSLNGQRVGIPNQLMSNTINASVRMAVQHAIEHMENLGAHISYFDFPFVDEALATYYIIAPAEVSSNLSRFDGVRFGYRHASAGTLNDMIRSSRDHGFGDEVKRRIMLGTYVLSSGYYDAYYGKAQHVRRLITQTFSDLFKTYDIICSPTAPTTAFKKGENTNDPMQMYLSDIATIPVNLAGLPGVSIPCGTDDQGLPIGFQLVGRWFDEHRIFDVAQCLEHSIGFNPKFSQIGGHNGI
jgi:aspartyl-tRNA(Asn)/glutamyl-tRNA(Gln) amidotransferase subunit A